ncbi:hypothetical protein NPIL_629801 [Nephila pilipes]|uniref:Uncharacterized protein n=1 Tax=Nephila pilipes TaxID=299642 RepID=A0A8X6TGH6_NEPPI|nr:hypothetical protein NPIL_629801 [Nephila pilipes]
MTKWSRIHDCLSFIQDIPWSHLLLHKQPSSCKSGFLNLEEFAPVRCGSLEKGLLSWTYLVQSRGRGHMLMYREGFQSSREQSPLMNHSDILVTAEKTAKLRGHEFSLRV